MRLSPQQHILIASGRPFGDLPGIFLALTWLLILATGSTNAKSTDQADSPLTPVVMQFDWIFNAQFAGFYQAIAQGYYARHGIEVELRGGLTTPDTVAATLDETRISFGSTESNVLLADVAAGAEAVALGTMFQDSPMGWMFIRDGAINHFSDLAQVRVGIHSDGARVLSLLLEQSGADATGLTTFRASHDPQQLFSGQADALQCYYIDEYVKLRQQIGDRAGIFLARDYGYRAYSQVIFTGRETVENHPEIVAAFLEATRDGWRYAFAHPEKTVELILSNYNPDLDRDYQLGSLARIEELMVPEPGALFRPMDPEVWVAGQAQLLRHQLISGPVDISALLAQQFLPPYARPPLSAD